MKRLIPLLVLSTLTLGVGSAGVHVPVPPQIEGNVSAVVIYRTGWADAGIDIAAIEEDPVEGQHSYRTLALFNYAWVTRMEQLDSLYGQAYFYGRAHRFEAKADAVGEPPIP